MCITSSRPNEIHLNFDYQPLDCDGSRAKRIMSAMGKGRDAKLGPKAPNDPLIGCFCEHATRLHYTKSMEKLFDIVRLRPFFRALQCPHFCLSCLLSSIPALIIAGTSSALETCCFLYFQCRNKVLNCSDRPNFHVFIIIES